MALALAINLLVLLALLGISGIRPVPMKDDGGTLVFDVPRQDEAAAPTKPAEQQRKKRRRPRNARSCRRPTSSCRFLRPSPRPTGELELVELTKQELSKTDEAMARQGGAGGARHGPRRGFRGGRQGTEGRDALRGRMAARADRAGDQPLYARQRPAGFGDDRLQDLSAISGRRLLRMGSVPASARLDRELMEAAWQFKVRPPRKNGQAMIGEWVRIRFDYGVRGE